MLKEGNYDMIFLDHRMPVNDVGDLENTDFHAFCDKLSNIGYNLIPLIKKIQPNAVIVGTSSLDACDLRKYPAPDYVIKKSWDPANITALHKQLEAICAERKLF